MSVSRAAGRASLMLMGLTLLSRVLGVVRDMVIAHLWGQNLESDIYTAAFRIPDILQYLVAGGALATVFVPVFTQYWEEGKEEDAWRIFSSVMSVVAVVALGLVLAMEAAAGPIARWMNPFLGDAKPGEAIAAAELAARKELAWSEVARLSRILLPAQWCFFVGGLMMGTLNARKRFLIPALGPIAYNLGQIVCGLALGRTALGIASMTWGALLGAAVGNFGLQAWELWRSGGKFRASFDTSHPGVRKVGALMLPALLGLSLSQLGFWITGSFAKGAGYLSALKNAYALTQAPIGIFAQASAIVLLPTISALAASGQMHGFRREVHYGIRRILFLTVPASLLMAVLAQPLIATMYLSHKFGPAEVLDASAALYFYSVGTFAWSAQAVLARGFYALQDSKTPTIITTSMVGLFVALCFALPPTGLGFRGLALALSVAGTVNMAIFYGILQRRVGGLDSLGLVRASLKIVLAALAAAAAGHLVLGFVWGGPQPVDLGGRGLALRALLVAGSASLVAYAAACLLLRVQELRTIREMFKKKGMP